MIFYDYRPFGFNFIDLQMYLLLFMNPFSTNTYLNFACADDVADYYQTVVKTVTPLDALKDAELPPNLHVQYEPHRFHPGKEANFIIFFICY